MSCLCIEPGSRLFRVRDVHGQSHQLSSYLLREAQSGDGILFPEDVRSLESLPKVVELWPWDSGGGVRDFAVAGLYLGMLRKRFSPVFRRSDWRVVLSPHLLASQSHVWGALLREASIRRYQLVSNLECLSWRLSEDAPGLYLHWGAGGGDLGLSLQGETFRYQRLLVGEEQLVTQLQGWLRETLSHSVACEEAFRVLRVATADGLAFPDGRLVEIGLGEKTTSSRASLEQEVLLQAILSFLTPQIETIEEFVRALGAEDQGELFEHGLRLSGGGVTLRLLCECLREAFEFPVSIIEQPSTSVLASQRLR